MEKIDEQIYFLNLPRKIVRSKTERDRFGQMKLLKETTQYRYLSDGSKVSSCDAGGNGYMYFGTARFTLDNNVPTFESIPFSGGRIVKTSNGYEPQYYLTDHLGSTRAIVNHDGQTVEATFDYTSFGVQIVNSQMPTNSTEYRFSGKELQNISDYEIYDFGARQYFPKYAIWGSVDPLSEKYYPITPYAYCANNPVNLIDPDGRMFDWYETLDDDLNKQIKYTELTSQQALDNAGINGRYLGHDVIVATHNRDDELNEPINTARFDLYLSSNPEGISATIFGNTVPADVSKFGTLAEGLYSAKFQSRQSYKDRNIEDLAIIINDGKDVPTVNGNPNKANSDMLDGVFLHMGNNYRESLFDRNGNAYSKGCQTTGHYKDSHKDHKKFMEAVGRDFNGFYYLRGK